MFIQPRKRFLACAAGLAFSCLIGATTLRGQGTIGTITGVVTDPSGSTIPDATVTILDEGKGVDFHLKTNEAGVYSITSLIPGKYTVTVAAKGFKTYVNKDLVLTVNQVLRVDVSMELGAETQTVTVEAAAPLINTEEGRLGATVSGTQVENMPLDGRNIYQLMQLVPGAVNTTSINLEQDNGGSMTNINGTRANFNGFLLDGMANKGLSGGSNAQPSPDMVQEFRIETNNFSAQYGNSAGSITDVSIKSGTNNFHGSVYEYFRNDKLNARNFFDGPTKQLWRQNQFGATLGGPIKKDRLFFFGGYEGLRFRTAVPKLLEVETPEWRAAVRAAAPGSTADYLYSQFPFPTNPTGGFTNLETVVNITTANDIGIPLEDLPGGSRYMAYLDPCFVNSYLGIGAPAFSGGPSWGNAQAFANRMAAIMGVTAEESAIIQSDIDANCPGQFTNPGAQAGTFPRDGNIKGLVNAQFLTRTTGVFHNGDTATSRVDYQTDKHRLFGRYIHFIYKDPAIDTIDSQFRGFKVPSDYSFPNAAFGWVYSISPTFVNEFRAGYTRNVVANIPDPSQFGVPNANFDFAEVGFGAYNGYPQFFKENVFHYSDMVSWVKGKHSVKFGGEYRRNQENSEFNVGRPSYYFFDFLYFAADLPYEEGGGVNPELVSGTHSAHLDTNIRAWRNYETGLFIQDDWKVKKNLTLNLGLRWDYYAPHKEKYGQMTKFTIPSGGIAAINCAAQIEGACVEPLTATGNTPNGGFSVTDHFFASDRNNFSPRFGFAWDPFGKGKTSIRGGFAVFFETTFWNSLSNSRWNLPFYSFNIAMPIFGYPGLPTYGPTNLDGTPSGAPPTHTGAPDNAGIGPAGAGWQGNLQGWLPSNPNLAYLTGIPDPSGLRSPYVENGFFGFQQELSPTTVLEVNWVGTFGHKLFWAENPNRVVNGEARGDILNPCTGDLETTAKVNPCFGTLRTWKNSVNSNYNSLQAQVNRKMSRGLAFTTSYTWSHWLDYRSTWHALTSSASATEYASWGASGYSLDPTKVFLEYGNSSFDIRHRLTGTLVWELPWMKGQKGVAGKILGGWQTNYLVSLQSGFPFTVGIKQDLNRDGFRNDRPNQFSFGNHYNFTNDQFKDGSGGEAGGSFASQLFLKEYDTVTSVAPGLDGNLGRNTFRGPGMATVDFSLFKKFPITEQFQLDFRAEFYNLFNRVNLLPPTNQMNSGTFGISTEAFDPRVIQFGLRLSF
jgi:hypothetical protein